MLKRVGWRGGHRVAPRGQVVEEQRHAARMRTLPLQAVRHPSVDEELKQRNERRNHFGCVVMRRAAVQDVEALVSTTGGRDRRQCAHVGVIGSLAGQRPIVRDGGGVEAKMQVIRAHAPPFHRRRNCE